MNSKTLKNTIIAMLALGMFIAGLNSPAGAEDTTTPPPVDIPTLENQIVAEMNTWTGKKLFNRTCDRQDLVDIVKLGIKANEVYVPFPVEVSLGGGPQTDECGRLKVAGFMWRGKGYNTAAEIADAMKRGWAAEELATFTPSDVGVAVVQAPDGTLWSAVELTATKPAPTPAEAAEQRKAEQRRLAKYRAATKKYKAKYSKCINTASKSKSKKVRAKKRNACRTTARHSCLKVETTKAGDRKCTRVYRKR